MYLFISVQYRALLAYSTIRLKKYFTITILDYYSVSQLYIYTACIFAFLCSSNQRNNDEVQEKKKKEKTQKTKKHGDNWKIYQKSYISELPSSTSQGMRPHTFTSSLNTVVWIMRRLFSPPAISSKSMVALTFSLSCLTSRILTSDSSRAKQISLRRSLRTSSLMIVALLRDLRAEVILRPKSANTILNLGLYTNKIWGETAN